MCYYLFEARQLYSVGLFFMQNMSEERGEYIVEDDNIKLRYSRKFAQSFSLRQIESLVKCLDEAKSVTGFGSVEIIIAGGRVRDIKVSKFFRSTFDN